jgi:hypothetical protein
MFYSAKSNGNGSYTVFKNGAPVQGARVRRISFPSITSHTLNGAVHHIAGPCVARISVPDEPTEIEDVPVIF